MKPEQELKPKHLYEEKPLDIFFQLFSRVDILPLFVGCLIAGTILTALVYVLLPIEVTFDTIAISLIVTGGLMIFHFVRIYLYSLKVPGVHMKVKNQIQAVFGHGKEIYEAKRPSTSYPENLLDLQESASETVMLTNREKEAYLEAKIAELSSLRIDRLERKEALLPLRNYFKKDSHRYVQEEFQAFLDTGNISFIQFFERNRIVNAHNSFINETIESYQHELAITRLGNQGEDKVEKELERIPANRVFSNLRIEYQGNSVEIDHLILSKRGIFFVETKNYAAKGQYTLRIAKDGQWQRKYDNGNLQPIHDVTGQQNRQTYFLRQLLNEEFQNRYGDTLDEELVPFVPFIVIANDHVLIDNETDMEIMRISQISHHMKKYNENYSERLLEVITEILEEKALPLKSYPFESYNEWMKTRFQHIQLLDQDIEAFHDCLEDIKQSLQEHEEMFKTLEQYSPEPDSKME
ncbi:NERD domain-containing protein [Radiobacillus kanasensis]|uniref:nuclease-related domain-containing protein n=1 Tax=Radiobacillus kanasensis TaxID=2844358 RepID=UPI001E454CD1|nr:nuclease-related domain-containing protein [Radiobacillus kanasensis]UFT99882.1 NERD domain-containing protein [Radiobacillus kanasensis]